MLTGPPQAFHLTLQANYPGARGNTNLNQNLNGEPWFATSDILISVEVGVNPVFSTKRVRLYKPVPCPRVQGRYWNGSVSNSPSLVTRNCPRGTSYTIT